MRRWVCTFSGAAYDKTTQLIAERSLVMGATDLAIYDEPWLMQTDFYRDNQWAWQHPGHHGQKYGFGWYVWKSYCIRQLMNHIDDGDIICWLDADTYPIADFSCLYDYCCTSASNGALWERSNGFFLFEASGCKDRQWVKRDVWQAVWPSCNPIGALDSQHATARFMLFQKGVPAVHRFLADWERLCCVPGLTTRDPSAELEYDGFEENRGDQSIFSLLTHKYNLPLHREADEFGASSSLDWHLYPQLFKQEYCQGDRMDLSGSKFRRIPE